MATPEDASSARKGESVFYFYWRAIPQGYVETWALERERLAKDGVSPFSLRNKLILWNLLCVIYTVLIWAFLGNKVLAYHLVQAGFGILLFEAINFIEHYGLERKKDANGNYESISIKHSWNAPQVVTNYLFFKLQRHSDHHANSYKPYQILESLPESPVLPYGYTVCLILSLFPPIWKKVINPYAEATNKDEKLS